jgi:hypothetical protein
MSKYIGYMVRAFAVRMQDGKPVYKEVPDREAELFCIYGHIGILNWEWIEDVPTREYGERRIHHLRRENRT